MKRDHKKVGQQQHHQCIKGINDDADDKDRSRELLAGKVAAQDEADNKDEIDDYRNGAKRGRSALLYGDIYQSIDDLGHAEPGQEMDVRTGDKQYGIDHRKSGDPVKPVGTTPRPVQQFGVRTGIDVRLRRTRIDRFWLFEAQEIAHMFWDRKELPSKNNPESGNCKVRMKREELA